MNKEIIIEFNQKDLDEYLKYANTRQRHTYDSVKDYFLEKGYFLIDTIYKNAITKLTFKDEIGYLYNQNFNKFQLGRTPSRFGNNNPYTMHNIKLWLKIHNSNITVIENNFVSAKTKMKCYCKECDNYYDTTWDCLSRNYGCDKCKSRLLSGANHWNYKGGISNLQEYLRHKPIFQWKQDTFKKYNYKCDITGATKNKIIHHLYSFDKILQETMETLNLPVYKKINKYTSEELKSIEYKCLELHYKYGLGVCLTEDIHKEFHHLYGYGENTLNQYLEFKEMKLKELNKGEI